MNAFKTNRRFLAALGLLIVLSVAGCGADDESPSTTAATSAPPATEATQTEATPSVTATQPKPAKKPKPAAPPPSTGASSGCSTPDTVSRLTFRGISCEQGAPIVTTWDASANECNTVDNPNSPEGYRRSCVIEDFACIAVRDTKSENRTVACTKGNAAIRFTWTP